MESIRESVLYNALHWALEYEYSGSRPYCVLSVAKGEILNHSLEGVCRSFSPGPVRDRTLSYFRENIPGSVT